VEIKKTDIPAYEIVHMDLEFRNKPEFQVDITIL